MTSLLYTCMVYVLPFLHKYSYICLTLLHCKHLLYFMSIINLIYLFTLETSIINTEHPLILLRFSYANVRVKLPHPLVLACL